MIDVLWVECRKYKKTFSQKLILLAPLFFVLLALPTKLLLRTNIKPWWLLLDQVFNWWPVIFLPIGMALFAALSVIQEKKAGNFRNLFIHHLAPSALWRGKILAMAYYSLLTTLVLVAAAVISGGITGGGPIPWKEILAAALTAWFVSLPLIPLQLWAALWKGTSFSLALGFAGLIAGVAAAPTPYWLLVPWSWPTRLMCPIIGVHPNGVQLAVTSPLRNPAVLPIGYVLAPATLVLLAFITAVWFERKEMR